MLIHSTLCCWLAGWVGPVAGITNTSPLYMRTRAIIERCSARLAQLEQAAGGKQHHRKYKQHKQHKQQQLAQSGSNTATSNSSSSSSSSSSGLPQQFLQEQQQLLKRRRKRLSHGLLEQIQHSYASSTQAGQPISLLDIYLQYTQQYNPALPITRAGQVVGMPAGAGDCCAPKLLHAAAAAGLIPTGLAEVWCGSAPGTATKAKMGRPITDNGLDPSSSRCA
jgi:tRNA pseudouridine32 synthase/23S rRNA pseudouridine746 synthase